MGSIVNGVWTIDKPTYLGNGLGACCTYKNRPIAFVLHINFIELSKINRILRRIKEANRMKFEVFVA
jgi:hypothetical protein